MNPVYYKSCVRCRRMEQRREAPTKREAREVILRVIDAQCNKRSPLVIIIMTNGGRDLGLQNKLYYIWWSTLLCALQKGNSGIVNYRFFNISYATHSNILSCFSVNE